MDDEAMILLPAELVSAAKGAAISSEENFCLFLSLLSGVVPLPNGLNGL